MGAEQLKTYEKVFSFIYCIVLLGCIVFRVESWPFSDWRVYSGRMMPRLVVFHEVQAEVDGQLIYPLRSNGQDLTVDDMFKKLSQSGSGAELVEYCDKVMENIFIHTPSERVVINRYQLSDNMEILKTELCARSRPDN
jgi:hypothetical protein